MIRRLSAVAASLLVLALTAQLGLAAASAESRSGAGWFSFRGESAGAVPPGPRLTFVREGSALAAGELISTDLSMQRWLRMAQAPHTSGAFENVSWSGDGTRLAFGSEFGSGIFTVPAAGGRPRAVKGTKRGFGPVFSADGRTIAFTRFRFRERKGERPYISASAWIVSADGGRARQLTPWRDGLMILVSSFSPDGSRLAAIKAAPGGPAVVVQPLDGGPASLIAKRGRDPVYSPDGSEIAYVSSHVRAREKRPYGPDWLLYGGDLYVAAADGSGSRRLTFTPDNREFHPSWDPSGQRLAFTQFPANPSFMAQSGVGSTIVEINADGTCRHRLLLTYGLSFSEPSWQPGPGRGAGRIEC